MMYILAQDQIMMILLTEQDVQSMRPGRTVFLDLAQSSAKRFTVQKVVLSLHKNAAAIQDIIKQAGQGHLLQDRLLGQPPKPDDTETTCAGCGGINKTFNLLNGQCIVCWHKAATKNLADAN